MIGALRSLRVCKRSFEQADTGIVLPSLEMGEGKADSGAYRLRVTVPPGLHEVSDYTFVEPECVTKATRGPVCGSKVMSGYQRLRAILAVFSLPTGQDLFSQAHRFGVLSCILVRDRQIASRRQGGSVTAAKPPLAVRHQRLTQTHPKAPLLAELVQAYLRPKAEADNAFSDHLTARVAFQDSKEMIADAANLTDDLHRFGTILGKIRFRSQFTEKRYGHGNYPWESFVSL
jgi:hypothetical protein